MAVAKVYTAEIGRRLERSASTVSRELRRNKGQYQPVYWYEEAQRWSERRRRESKGFTKKRNRGLYKYIVRGLHRGWSPELISGRMRREYPGQENMRVSAETIYRWVYRDAACGGELYKLLSSQHKRRRRHRRCTGFRGRIKDRVGIEQRPGVVESRSRFGDWESEWYDLE